MPKHLWYVTPSVSLNSDPGVKRTFLLHHPSFPHVSLSWAPLAASWGPPLWFETHQRREGRARPAPGAEGQSSWAFLRSQPPLFTHWWPLGLRVPMAGTGRWPRHPLRGFLQGPPPAIPPASRPAWHISPPPLLPAPCFPNFSSSPALGGLANDSLNSFLKKNKKQTKTKKTAHS